MHFSRLQKSFTYADAGVNIELGDAASKTAYNCAKSTFSGRKGLIGEPVVDDGGFAGLLDMGEFYLVQGAVFINFRVLSSIECKRVWLCSTNYVSWNVRIRELRLSAVASEVFNFAVCCAWKLLAQTALLKLLPY